MNYQKNKSLGEVFADKIEYISIYCFGSTSNQFGIKFSSLFDKEFKSIISGLELYYNNLKKCQIIMSVDMLFGWLVDKFMEAFGRIAYPMYLEKICRQTLCDYYGQR